MQEDSVMNALSTSTAAPVVLASPSSLGHLVVAVRCGKLERVAFGYRTGRAAIAWLNRRLELPADPCEEHEADRRLAQDVLARLLRFADGEEVDFSDVSVAEDHLTPFGRRVVRACRAIGWGEVRTYGELAAAAGARGAARAVGQVMAGNRTPLVVPCHRVIASNGGLGGFSAPEGLAMKRRLLNLESAAETTKPGRASSLPPERSKTRQLAFAKMEPGA